MEQSPDFDRRVAAIKTGEISPVFFGVAAAERRIAIGIDPFRHDRASLFGRNIIFRSERIMRLYDDRHGEGVYADCTN